MHTVQKDKIGSWETKVLSLTNDLEKFISMPFTADINMTYFEELICF